MGQTRSSGILLHPTSLPGAYGIGDLGPSAYRFIDFLQRSGQTLWQMLPLGPTGYGDSPYQTLSAFGGNPMLISPELLVEDDLLYPKEIEAAESDQTHRVVYEQVIPSKLKLLKKAYLHFKLRPNHFLAKPFHTFCEKEAVWLEDFVLFFALKSHHDNRPWTEWPKELRMRHPKALASYAEKLQSELQWHRFVQFLFFRQFGKLHDYAKKHHVKLIGDLPIFLAHDSSDVWSHRKWFKLDKDGHPTVVAGVPPDYFSKTGQRWGNPLFDWKVLKKEKYRLWVDRFSHMAEMFDLIRIDHFRGFASYWEIPAIETTAIYGRWQKGPGVDLFNTLEQAVGGKLPVIAEDLGIVTQDVTDLIEALDYPGMAVLQFGFESMQSDDPSAFLPHNLKTNQVVYTGTHDNDTVVGWWNKQSEEVRDFTRRYLNTDANLIHRDMIRTALGTVCTMALFPMQDLLGLGSEAYMNHPGTTGGNWQWRMENDALSTQLEEDLLAISILYGRTGSKKQKKKQAAKPPKP
jgi:4-alpha-glucanotransferase